MYYGCVKLYISRDRTPKYLAYKFTTNQTYVKIVCAIV